MNVDVNFFSKTYLHSACFHPRSVHPSTCRGSYGESESRSVLWDSATPWTIQSMAFSRPGYRSGLPFPSPGHLPNPGIKPRSPTLQVDSLPAEPPGKPELWWLGPNSPVGTILPSCHRAFRPGLTSDLWAHVGRLAASQPCKFLLLLVSSVRGGSHQSPGGWEEGVCWQGVGGRQRSELPPL